MTGREKVLNFLEKRGALIVFSAASLLFFFLRLKLFCKYGLSQDEVLIISQIKTWGAAKIWHYYGFGGQGFFLQHYIFYILTLGGLLCSEAYLKIICLVESYIGFLLLYRFTKRFFGSFAAFAALILYSIAPFQIIYTLYVRFYALVMTLVIAECFTYMLALEHNEIKLRLRYLALTLLFALLSYCTHQFSVFLQPVFLLHFIIFCFWRRFARESLYYYLSGALLLIAFSVGAYFFSEPLMKAASLVYGTQNAWLPHQIGLASQRLQTFFWSSALPIRSCSLIFLWVSLGLAAAARLGRRQPLWGELFLSLGIVIPFFFLSHFHFSHFFAERYLAFWFPLWILVWSCWLEFPAFFVSNLKVLENKRVLGYVGLGIFFLVFLFSLFRWSTIEKMRWLEHGNREAVAYLETIAHNNGLPLVIISEPDAASKNNILPQYYFTIKGHKGESVMEPLKIMRKGAAFEKAEPTAVVWTQCAKRLSKPDAFTRSQIGVHEIIYGGVFTNWNDIAQATAKVIPGTASLLIKPLPKLSCSILDVGTKEASNHLLTGFSNDEFISQNENFTWCVGTNIFARFSNDGESNYVIAARCRAFKKLTAVFFLNGVSAGDVDIGEDFTNIIMNVEDVPVTIKDAPLILNIVTSAQFVPGKINKEVYDSRPLSLCFDKLTVWKAPRNEYLGAAIYVENPSKELKAGSTWKIKLHCANLGDETWIHTGDQPVRLSVRWYDEAGQEIQDDRIWLEKDVFSGEDINITASLKVPDFQGSCRVEFDFVLENVCFFREPLIHYITIRK